MKAQVLAVIVGLSTLCATAEAQEPESKGLTAPKQGALTEMLDRLPPMPAREANETVLQADHSFARACRIKVLGKLAKREWAFGEPEFSEHEVWGWILRMDFHDRNSRPNRDRCQRIVCYQPPSDRKLRMHAYDVEGDCTKLRRALIANPPRLTEPQNHRD